MATTVNNGRAIARPIPHLRWWIGGLLFASTVINYVDRQTLSLLAPFLKLEYHWSNTDYANLLVGFRVAYSVGQTVFGRLMDRLGTRRGLSFTVLGYSIVSPRCGSCSARENPLIGRQRPRQSRSGFPNASAAWRRRSSIAALPSAPRFRPFWFCGSTSAGGGVLPSSFLDCWGWCG